MAFSFIKFEAQINLSSPPPVRHSSPQVFHLVFVFGDITISGRHLPGTFLKRFQEAHPEDVNGCQTVSGWLSCRLLPVAEMFVRKGAF